VFGDREAGRAEYLVVATSTPFLRRGWILSTHRKLPRKGFLWRPREEGRGTGRREGEERVGRF